MSATDIVAILHNLNVPDITGDLKGPGSDPVSVGSSGNLYHMQCNTDEVAIRTIRVFLVFNPKNQRLLKAAADELDIWGRLDHKNIVPLLGVACFQDQAALVSPWVHYGSLKDYRCKHPSFNWLKLATEVADAVAYLHNAGVIHGDLKSQNVLVSTDGHAKLTGFSNTVLQELASHYTDGKDFSTLSMRWIAPEVLQGTATKSAEIDVYALGLTILEIITGQIPFANESDQQVIVKILNHAIPPRPHELDSHDALWALLTQCWSSNPSARPSATEVYNNLKRMPQSSFFS